MCVCTYYVGRERRGLVAVRRRTRAPRAARRPRAPRGGPRAPRTRAARVARAALCTMRLLITRLVLYNLPN